MINGAAVFDTNWIAATLNTAHVHHTRVSDFFSKHLNKTECILLPQVCYELWAVLTRPQAANGFGMTALQSARAIQRLKNHYVFLPDPSVLMDRWLDVVRDYHVLGKNAHDARIAAAAQLHNCPFILTLNPADFARYPFIQTITPET